MTLLWCELAWLGGDAAEEGVLVEIEGERFKRVEAGHAAAPEGTERLEGLTLPGFANAHSHAFHRALRGRSQSGRGSFWTWREQMYGLAAALDPDSYQALARATFAEMALAGITAVGEFHYLHHDRDGSPYADPNAMGRAMLAAAAEAGIRITLLDTCYLHAGIGAEPEGVQVRFADGDVAAWGQRVEALGNPGPGAKVGAAIHSVRAVAPDEAAVVAGWARERSSPLHAHVSEQPAENEACVAAHGRTPIGVLDEAGAVDERFTAVHFTHVDGDDIALLGGRRATCCLCSTTERDLADGVGPARAIADAGAALALGSDSHAVIDHFEEMRAVELDERLVTGERGHHDPAELLRAATSDGHRSIGFADAGRIEPGALADLVTVSLDGPRLAGTDPASALAGAVFASSPADVSSVIASGRPIVRDGRHVSVDVAAELELSIRGLHP